MLLHKAVSVSFDEVLQLEIVHHWHFTARIAWNRIAKLPLLVGISDITMRHISRLIQSFSSVKMFLNQEFNLWPSYNIINLISFSILMFYFSNVLPLVFSFDYLLCSTRKAKSFQLIRIIDNFARRKTNLYLLDQTMTIVSSLTLKKNHKIHNNKLTCGNEESIRYRKKPCSYTMFWFIIIRIIPDLRNSMVPETDLYLMDRSSKQVCTKESKFNLGPFRMQSSWYLMV